MALEKWSTMTRIMKLYGGGSLVLKSRETSPHTLLGIGSG